jgi:HEAT repeat protein
LDFFDAMPIEQGLLGTGHDVGVIEQITHLEPSSAVEKLPETDADEQLARALELVVSNDVQERAEALKILAQFRVQSSINAITLVARQDSEANIRSMAIASLGAMDHESAFPAIVIGMTDDTREVRASAARALNRLSFDRADAYVRVIETGDEETVRDVAKACIQAGIVSQNIDRLASSDHRQAYETFSLICLLAKANMSDPILDAIAAHPNEDVRLMAIHLLASAGQPDTFEQLRQLAVRDGVTEEVKTALLEAMYKLDQEAKRKEQELADAVAVEEQTQFENVSPEPVESQEPAGFAFEFALPSEEEETQATFEMEAPQLKDELES